MRIVIVGGGLIGTCFALEAVARGAEVVVVDRTGLHAEASTAGAGILGADAEAMTSGHEATHAIEAREALMAWVPELEARTRLAVRSARRGTLVLAATADERALYTEWLARHDSLGALLSADDVVALQPAMAPPPFGGVLFERDGSLEPARLGSAVSAALRETSATVHCGEAIVSFEQRGARVHGVRLASGTTIEGDAVVLAAGAWSSDLLASVGLADDAHPLRGQLLELRPLGAELRPVVFEGKRYIVPRGDGRYVVGSTMERVGFDRTTTDEARAALLAFAERVVPAFRGAEVAAHWAGLRPFREAGPRIGGTAIPGLFTSFGHGRNGILFCRKSALDLAQAMGL